jgi:hypothetical protein
LRALLRNPAGFARIESIPHPQGVIMAAERNSSSANHRSEQKPGSASARSPGPQARRDAAASGKPDSGEPGISSRRPDQPAPSGTGMDAAVGPGEIARHDKSNTERSEAMQNAASGHAHAPGATNLANVHAANKVNADASAAPTSQGAVPSSPPGAGDASMPNLFFTAPRVEPESNPAARTPPPASTGNANLTSHLNDPAMRRSPAQASQSPGAALGSHSDVSPLARDAATPLDESTRLKQEAAAADARARRTGIDPRGDVAAWHQAEENRQSDLPGRPRTDLPGLE